MGKRDRYKICGQEFFTIAGEHAVEGGIPLPVETFEQLERFILEKRMPDLTGNRSYILTPQGSGDTRTLKAAGYVGSIVFKDGTQVEILPMLSGVDEEGNKLSQKRILLNMIHSMKSLPLSNSNINLNAVEGLNIFEMFVLSFINDVQIIIRNSLKRMYVPYTNNERFLKGKVVYNLHATKNFAHKDKFYVQYNVFSINRPENKLIKSTIKHLKEVTSSARNRNRLEVLLANFDGIDDSMNYEQDFASSIVDRNMAGYGNALKWAEIFLLGKGVNLLSGRDVVYAMVYTMEELFDSYIVSGLSRMLNSQTFRLEPQRKFYPRINRSMPKLNARAAAVITMRENGLRVVVDSKWQELSVHSENAGIYDSDIANLYSLLDQYNADHICYLYPLTEALSESEQEISFMSEGMAIGRVCFVDIGKLSSLTKIVEHTFGLAIKNVEKLK